MATLSPSLKEPQTTSGHGGGTHDRFPGGGGGGGGRGDHDRDYGEQIRRYRLAMAVGLVAIFMLFLSFSTAFLLHEKFGVPDQGGGYTKNWRPVTLPVNLLLFNTGLLILSSVTFEKARRQAFQQAAVSVAAVIPGVKFGDTRRFPWLGVTLLLGLGFCAGQYAAWRILMDQGIYMSVVRGSSFFYVATGLHAIHLLAGMLALAYAGVVVYGRRGLDRRRVTLDVTSWYWHSMTVLWVYLLFLLVVVR